MSEAKKIAGEAASHIEDLLADMFESGAPNNHIVLGTLSTESNEAIQVQLIVTRNVSEFLDD